MKRILGTILILFICFIMSYRDVAYDYVYNLMFPVEEEMDSYIINGSDDILESIDSTELITPTFISEISGGDSFVGSGTSLKVSGNRSMIYGGVTHEVKLSDMPMVRAGVTHEVKLGSGK